MALGRISLLLDSPLRDLHLALREVPKETRKRINQQVKKNALPIWHEELQSRAGTRVETRVLVDSARVGVTDRNVFLRSAGVGTLRDGTPVQKLSTAAEFGRPATAPIKSRDKNGKPYTRRTGHTFRERNRKGLVVFPSARDAIPRFASLQIQTAAKALYDAFEKVN